jgi:Xaa-Pro aminopeptidase
MVPVTADELRGRRSRVAEDLARRGLAGAIVSDPANVRYLGGFALGQPWASRTRPTVCVLDANGRLVVVASADVTLDDPAVDAVLQYRRPADMPATVAGALQPAAAIGAELGDEHRLGMAVDQLREIERLHGQPFGDAAPSLWAARLIKSEAELDRLRTAIAVNDRIYARLFAGELRAGESERELGRRIRRMMLEEGADEPGWVIIASGAGAYDRMLSSPRERVIERGDLVWLDMGCTVDGYWSDHSRAAVLGTPSAEQVELQARVIEATRRGIDAVVPGAVLGDVAAACTLAAEALPGRVGHGLGLGSTEPPDVVEGSILTLAPGMVFTIEPAAVREHGMFQAEAVVAVTAAGHQVLTTAPEAISSV